MRLSTRRREYFTFKVMNFCRDFPSVSKKILCTSLTYKRYIYNIFLFSIKVNLKSRISKRYTQFQISFSKYNFFKRYTRKQFSLLSINCDNNRIRNRHVIRTKLVQLCPTAWYMKQNPLNHFFVRHIVTTTRIIFTSYPMYYWTIDITLCPFYLWIFGYTTNQLNSIQIASFFEIDIDNFDSLFHFVQRDFYHNRIIIVTAYEFATMFN